MYNYKVHLEYEDTEGFMQEKYTILTHENKFTSEEFNHYCLMAKKQCERKWDEYYDIVSFLKHHYGFREIKIESCFGIKHTWSR